jgi:crossover junction endodeoxyribonuclease RuvC
MRGGIVTTVEPVSDRIHVLGVDLSLTSTGIATGHVTLRHRPPKDLTGLHRMRWIRTQVLALAALAELVVIEGLAYASHTGKASERAGLWWMVMDALDEIGAHVAVVSPAGRAKYATGKGNAGKDAVLAAVVKRYPGFEVSGNDQADALVLAAMGLDHLGEPLAVMPQTHRAALDAVQWPEVTHA